MKKLYLLILSVLFIIPIYSKNNEISNIDYYEEGMKYYIAGNYSDALNMFSKGLEFGDKVMCPQMMGEIYYLGLGVSKNDNLSTYYFRIAATNDNPYAQYSLGLAYYNGIGCSKNDVEARKYYKLSAESNLIPEACFNYACMLYNGEGGIKDLNESFIYYQKAAEMGFPDAQYCVALVFYYGEYNGIRTKQDKRKAYELLNKSASKGYTRALIALDQLF